MFPDVLPDGTKSFVNHAFQALISRRNIFIFGHSRKGIDDITVNEAAVGAGEGVAAGASGRVIAAGASGRVIAAVAVTKEPKNYVKIRFPPSLKEHT